SPVAGHATDPHAADEQGGHDDGHAGTPHESSAVMWLPLVILAVPSILSGLVNAGGFLSIGHPFGDFVKGSLPQAMREGEEHDFVPWLATVPSRSAVLAIIFAAAFSMVGRRVQVALARPFQPLYTLFARKYFMDDIYETGIVRGLGQNGVFRLAAWFDSTVVDGVVNGA